MIEITIKKPRCFFSNCIDEMHFVSMSDASIDWRAVGETEKSPKELFLFETPNSVLSIENDLRWGERGIEYINRIESRRQIKLNQPKSLIDLSVHLIFSHSVFHFFYHSFVIVVFDCHRRCWCCCCNCCMWNFQTGFTLKIQKTNSLFIKVNRRHLHEKLRTIFFFFRLSWYFFRMSQ